MNTKRVLIADDQERVRLVLRECLEAEGYEVREAGDGFEALDAIIQWVPDVMILDLAMPNLDGMQTLGELQAVHPQFKPRIIVLTAFGTVPTAVKALGLGVSAFLEKPTQPEMLREVVRRAFSERDAAEHAGTDAAAAKRDPHFFG